MTDETPQRQQGTVIPLGLICAAIGVIIFLLPNLTVHGVVNIPTALKQDIAGAVAFLTGVVIIAVAAIQRGQR